MGGRVSQRREPLTRARITAEAAAIIDRDGLGALSMDGLGAKLGVSGMAIYKHFPRKATLLDSVVAALLESLPLPPVADSWQRRLLAFYEGLWELYRAHPRALPLVSSQAFAASTLDTCCARGPALLSEAGLEPDVARQTLVTLAAHALGFSVLVAGGYYQATPKPEAGPQPQEKPEPGIDWAKAERDYRAGLETVLAGIEKRLT